VVTVMPLSIYLRGNSALYPSDKKLCGPQSLCGCYGEEKNRLSIAGMEPRFLCRPAHSIVAIPTGISRLQRKYVLKQSFAVERILRFVISEVRELKFSYQSVFMFSLVHLRTCEKNTLIHGLAAPSPTVAISFHRDFARNSLNSDIRRCCHALVHCACQWRSVLICIATSPL
jgi:hypothetical protein